MNWEAIGTVGELVGAIGVIASLLFLAFETRKNTTTMRASLSNEVLTATAELNDVILGDSDLRRIVSTITDPRRTVESLGSEEKDAAIYLGRALFMRNEGVFMLYKQRLVEPAVWEGRRVMLAGLIQIPIFREYWNTDQKLSVFTKDFIDAVNTASPIDIVPPISANSV